VTGATAYIDALRGAADDRSPPARLRAHRGDLLNGYRAEVWMQREASFAGLADRHRARPSTGRVSLVLGAGRIASIAALAVLHELFAQGSVVVAKLDPAEVSVRQSLERVFRPLVSAGFVRFAHGRGDVGDYLARHAGVDAVHIAGSAPLCSFILAKSATRPSRSGRRSRAGSGRRSGPVGQVASSRLPSAGDGSPARGNGTYAASGDPRSASPGRW
jgi:hypothetical protein